MRSQKCREMIEWTTTHCHDLSPDAVSKVKHAFKFVAEKAPYLENESTATVHKIRTIKDPIVQGDVLKIVKKALEENTDPRTGDKLRSSGSKITTPMVNWIIKWVETGEKPPYVKRGTIPVSTAGRKITLSKDKIDVLMAMREAGIREAIKNHTPDMVIRIKQLYSELVGEVDAS